MSQIVSRIWKPVQRRGAERYLQLTVLSFAASVSVTRLILRTNRLPTTRKRDTPHRTRTIRRRLPLRSQPTTTALRQSLGIHMERNPIWARSRLIHRRGGKIHHPDKRLLLPSRSPDNIRFFPTHSTALPENKQRTTTRCKKQPLHSHRGTPRSTRSLTRNQMNLRK